MCFTTHYVSDDWTLEKKILIFSMIEPPHTTIGLTDAVTMRLLELEVGTKVSTITLDNCSTNDSAASLLKDQLSSNGVLLFNGLFFHARCCEHILNIIVQDGLSEIKDAITRVREAVKYMKASHSCKKKFDEIVQQLQMTSKKGLSLNVSTR